MPTKATSAIAAHLSKDPVLEYDETGRARCHVTAWTADKDRRSGEKIFTTWRGTVFGKPAEWLAEGGKKGSLVFLSGSTRVDLWIPDNGEPRASIEFTRLNEAILLDDNRQQGQQNSGRSESSPVPPPADLDDSAPPF
jgi:single-stranded DNA-binding protein